MKLLSFHITMFVTKKPVDRELVLLTTQAVNIEKKLIKDVLEGKSHVHKNPPKKADLGKKVVKLAVKEEA